LEGDKRTIGAFRRDEIEYRKIEKPLRSHEPLDRAALLTHWFGPPLKGSDRQFLSIVGVCSLVFLGVLVGVGILTDGIRSVSTPSDAAPTLLATPTSGSGQKRQDILTHAATLAASYDYDGAIELIKTWPTFADDAEMREAIASYQAIKETLVPVDIFSVTHIFYHSLIVDPQRAFAEHDWDGQSQGMNQWMTTVDEFNMITQEMYDRGFVLVSIHDLIHETTDENGRIVFEPGIIMLPPDKKAFVMSIDDVSYYHNYGRYGLASRLLIDEQGAVVAEYEQSDGTILYGAYDVVPLLDQFIEQHPDASYKGAKGIIALTGYNGVLGYRTDETYGYGHPEMDGEQAAFLAEHPDFDLEAERQKAKEVADAMKADGWQFASHTWGHLKAGSDPLGDLVADAQRWTGNVEPIVGPTDVLILAFGEDFQGWENYDRSEARFQFFYDLGFRIFCGVSPDHYKVWLGDDYLRMNRRNLDGYRIYFNSIGVADDLWDLFDPTLVLDPARPPVMELTHLIPGADAPEEEAEGDEGAQEEEW